MMDDLLIVSDSIDSHLKALSSVGSCIRAAGLTLNVEKSNFCMKSVNYLGHKVGEGVVRTDPDKMSAITNFPVPKALKALRRFFGMVCWYRNLLVTSRQC